jgi:hypothetical protein
MLHPCVKQGGQIWLVFADWAVLFFGQFFENYRRSPNFWSTFFHGRSYELIFTSFTKVDFGQFYQNESGHPGVKLASIT